MIHAQRGSALNAWRPRYGSVDPKQRAIACGVMVLVHAVAVLALASSTTTHAPEVIRKPLEAILIQEVIILPAPPPPVRVQPSPQPIPIAPPPPKQVVRAAAPETSPAPPPFFAHSEPALRPVEPAPIQAVQNPPSTPAAISPAELPVSTRAPAQPAPAGLQAIGVVCPVQVRPEMPRQALKLRIEGVVEARATIRNGKVVDVQIVSGPRAYHDAVRSAMLQYECAVSPEEAAASQDFHFKFDARP